MNSALLRFLFPWAVFVALTTAARADFPQSERLPLALNNPGRTFEESDHPFSPIGWTTDTVVTHDGVEAGRSGPVPPNQNAAVLTTIEGPGTLTFWWKVSCHVSDRFYFLVNGADLQFINGETGWIKVSQALAAGPNVIEWRYGKSGTLEAGADAGWLDEVAFIPPAGDADYHLDARVSFAFITRSTLVYTETDPALASFRGRALLDFQQLDEAALPPVQTTLPVRVTWAVDNASTATQVASGDYDTTVTLPSHTGGASPLPGTAALTADFNFTAGANLSVDPLTPYRLRVTARFTDPGGNQQAVTGEAATGNSRLLTLSGRLAAGSVETRFREITWSPGVTAGEPPGHLLEVDSAMDAVWLLSDPTVRFRLSFNIVYRNPNSGDLELRAGIPVNLPGYTKSAGNLPVTVTGATLTENGFTGGGVSVRLPAGMGVGFGSTTRLMESDLGFIGLAVDPATGLPVQEELAYAPGAPLYISHDQVPVRFHPLDNRIIWNVADGTFRCGETTASHVANREDAWLRADAAAGALDDNAAAQKPANDGPWRTVENSVLPAFFIRTDAEGIALLNATVPFAAGAAVVQAHFPSRVQFTVTGGGVTVADGVFDPASSVTLGPSVSLTYERDAGGAEECGLSAAGSATLTFPIQGNALFLTPDGGWRGAVILDSAARVEWGGRHPGAGGGQATHQLSGLGPASFFLPGTWLAGAATPGTAMDRRASALLLSGTGQAGYREFPDTGPYAAGLADYAGLNLHRPAGGLSGRSYLAKSDTSYALKPHSKFIVRRGGVTGVLDAVTASLSPALRLYDYASELDGLRLSFVDSKNKESATAGHISLPEPAGFDVAFERLTFTPGGHLDDAELPANPGSKPLVYWGCQLVPDMLDFTPERSGACSTGISYLTLGGRISLGAISPTPVRGALAFKPDGNLITPADNLAKGVDSSLPVPSGLVIKGRGELSYPFTPATRLRFNNQRAVPADQRGAGQGFLFAAGTMDVPFFEDLKVMLHLAAFSGTYQVMGGWHSDPAQSGQGWTEPDNRNYFTRTDFDPDNFGYPGAAISGLPPASSLPVSLENFRNGLETGQKYRPWVRKDWRKLIAFEFPMKWDAVGRQFLNAKSEDLDLVVLTAAAQVRSLDAAGAEITFGTEFKGLPNFNAQGLSRALTDAASLATGTPEKKLADALSNALTGVVQASVIGEGKKALEELVDDTLKNVLETALPRGVRAAATGAFEPFYEAFRADYERMVRDGNSTLSELAVARILTPPATVAELGGQLEQQLRGQVLGSIGNAETALKAIDGRLEQAHRAITEILKLCNPDQPAPVTPPTVNPSLGSANPFLQSIARQIIVQQLKEDFLNHGNIELRNQLNNLLSDLVKEARPVLRQITVALTEARTAIEQMRASLDVGGNAVRDLKAKLETAFNAVALVREKTMKAFLDELGASRDASRNFFGENSVDALRERFVQTAINQFHASKIDADMRKALKKLVGPVQQAVSQAVDLVFAQVNNMVNAVALKLIRDLRNEIIGNEAFDDLRNGVAADFEAGKAALGTFGDDYLTTSANIAKTLQFAKAQGYARTNGDTLEEVRLDARIGLAVPDEIGFSGYVHIRNFESDVPSTTCQAAGAVATEIALGSTAGVTMKRGKNDNSQQGTMPNGLKPFQARVEGRFSFPPGAGVRVPNALGGMIDFQSDMDMGAMTLKQVKLRFGLGGDEAWAIAAGRGSIWFIEGEGRIFLGATKQKAILKEALDIPTYLAVVDPLPAHPDPAMAEHCLAKPVIGVYGSYGGHLSVNRLFGIPDSPMLSLSAGRMQSLYAFVTDGDKLKVGMNDSLSVQGKFLYVIGLSGGAGYLLQGNLDLENMKREGLMGLVNGLSGTAIMSVEGCASVFLAKVCGRVDMIFDIRRNPVFPPVLPPIYIEPVGIKY